MNDEKFNPVGLKSGLVLSAAGGLMATLSWPEPSLWPLCLVCLVPLWWSVRGQSARRSFFFGWVYGLSLGLSSFSWLAEVMGGYGGLGTLGGLAILVLLAAFLALYQGVWAWLINPFTFGGWGLIGETLAAGVFWVGLDWLKNWVLTGFNWTPLAGALASYPRMLGAADLVGVYGLGLFCVLVNGWLTVFLSQRRTIRARVGILALSLAPVAFMAAYGTVTYHKWEKAWTRGDVKTVAVLQASVEQEHKWDRYFREQVLNRYNLLASQAQVSDPWLIVWSETAAPFVYDLDEYETRWLKELRRRNPAPMLVGLAALEMDGSRQRLHNRAWLMENDSEGSYYDKMHLVPFGEYVPMADDLPFLKWPFVQGLLGAAGVYNPGKPQPLIYFKGHRLGINICFESIFPYLARERVADGADILVVTTNDSWFGHSWAPAQHLSQAVMRSVENRRPLLRAANNGLSALISPSGRIVSQSQLDEVGAFIFPLATLDPGDLEITFFNSYGYLLAPLAAILTGIVVLQKLFFSRKRKKVAVF